MAEVAYQFERTGLESFILTFTSLLTDPWYYIYRGALFVKRTLDNSWSFVVPLGEMVTIQVFDDETDTPDMVFPGSLIFHWDAMTGAATYRIEELADSVWGTVATIRQTTEEEFRWPSRLLEDVTTHQFRVTGVTAGGVDGDTRDISVLMVRTPDEDKFTLTLNDDQTLHIEEVAA